MSGIIASFGKGTEYRWLSNFTDFETPMMYQGLAFRSVEHFYVAMKTMDMDLRKEVSMLSTAGKVKRFGKELVLRSDWDIVKDMVMELATKHKYSEANPILREKLIATGDKYLQEGNHWGDEYWGVNLKTGEGLNKLGEILMKVREEISK
jgi:ribA/ribD-fused uncharacterized protein